MPFSRLRTSQKMSGKPSPFFCKSNYFKRLTHFLLKKKNAVAFVFLPPHPLPPKKASGLCSDHASPCLYFFFLVDNVLYQGIK